MMRTYDSYKDSGIEWIGEIPRHWELLRLKNTGSLYSGLSGKSGDDFRDEDNPQNRYFIPFTNIFRNTYITKDNLGQVVIQDGETQNRVQRNDIFFLMSSEDYKDLGKTSILTDDYDELYLNSFCKGLRVIHPNVYPLYLNFQLSGYTHKKLISVEGSGFTRINLRQDKLLTTPVLIPPLSEQEQIVSYLDEKTSLIDEMVEKKKRKIELLKEYRTSLINTVVTKGLNPDVPKKDSGIEWIGEIPRHWVVGKLGFYTSKIGSGLTPKGGSEIYSESGIPFIRSQNVHFQGLVLDNVSYIDIDIHNSMSGSKVSYNDVLLNITGGSIGRCCVVQVNQEMNVNQHVCIIRTNNKLSPYYLNYLLSSTIGQSQVTYNISGGNREGLTVDGIKDIIIDLPPFSEQEQIVSYLDEKTGEIDKTIELENKKIDFLIEYRQSLISNVVTGKIKVTIQ